VNTAVWTIGIASVVAVTIFAAIKRMHAKSSSIGTSPLADELPVSTTPGE
jgi:hypothetical protein